jgi:hypothetical protein
MVKNMLRPLYFNVLRQGRYLFFRQEEWQATQSGAHLRATANNIRAAASDRQKDATKKLQDLVPDVARDALHDRGTFLSEEMPTCTQLKIIGSYVQKITCLAAVVSDKP